MNEIPFGVLFIKALRYGGLLCAAACSLFFPVDAMADEVRHLTTVSTVVNGVCGLGTFYRLETLQIQAYNGAKGGDAIAANKFSRDRIATANFCLLGDTSAVAYCNAERFYLCTRVALVTTVSLKTGILEAQDMIALQMGFTQDPGVTAPINDEMSDASDLCRYPGINPIKGPFTQARVELDRVFKFAALSVSSPITKDLVNVQLPA